MLLSYIFTVKITFTKNTKNKGIIYEKTSCPFYIHY